MSTFTFCAYWGTWSRVLCENHPLGPTIELDLTPINCRDAPMARWRQEVGQFRIRSHATAFNPNRDKRTHELPAEVVTQMVANLGETLTHRLLYEDILSQIDWSRYEQSLNAYANPAYLYTFQKAGVPTM